MNRDSVNGQRFEDISYVDLWAACYTNMKICKAKLDKLFDEHENPLARRGNSRGVGTFIKGVDY
jgi:hypothetical protein